MTLTLFGCFFLFLLIGLPVAFSTGLAAFVVVLNFPIVQEHLLITKTFGDNTEIGPRYANIPIEEARQKLNA